MNKAVAVILLTCGLCTAFLQAEPVISDITDQLVALDGQLRELGGLVVRVSGEPQETVSLPPAAGPAVPVQSEPAQIGPEQVSSKQESLEQESPEQVVSSEEQVLVSGEQPVHAGEEIKKPDFVQQPMSDERFNKKMNAFWKAYADISAQEGFSGPVDRLDAFLKNVGNTIQDKRFLKMVGKIEPFDVREPVETAVNSLVQYSNTESKNGTESTAATVLKNLLRALPEEYKSRALEDWELSELPALFLLPGEKEVKGRFDVLKELKFNLEQGDRVALDTNTKIKTFFDTLAGFWQTPQEEKYGIENIQTLFGRGDMLWNWGDYLFGTREGDSGWFLGVHEGSWPTSKKVDWKGGKVKAGAYPSNLIALGRRHEAAKMFLSLVQALFPKIIESQRAVLSLFFDKYEKQAVLLGLTPELRKYFENAVNLNLPKTTQK